MVDDQVRVGSYSALIAGIVICGLAAVALFLPVIQDSPRGELLGLLLLLAGLAEAGTGWLRRRLRTGRSALGAGVVAMVLGALFLFNPSLHLVPTSYLIILWLFSRGVLLLFASIPWTDPEHAWLAVSGFADIGLFVVLLVGLPVTALTLSLFGPTEEVVANFSLVVAVSLAVAGLSLIVISMLERREPEATE
ncbi:MAG TPA: hypothetical protein VGD10_09945 [Allosphingosinicella sp.]|uniref:hypothetical protein n=1 Tax=Allosphingosinicella sp. TaxID=2823234 RepID=UPI002ED8B118